MKDIISIELNGKDYVGFKSAVVSDSFVNLCKQYSFTVGIPETLDGYPIKLSAPCRVKINDILVLTGYVDEIVVTQNYNAREISATGSDKLSDLLDSTVDSSIIQPFSGNVYFDDVCRTVLSKLKIKANVIVESSKRTLFVKNDYVAPQTGEGFFEYLDKYAKKSQVYLGSSPSGDLVLRDAQNAKTINTSLIYKKGDASSNILISTARFNTRVLFNKYRCHAQQQKLPVFVESIETPGDFDYLINSVLGESENASIRQSRVYNFISDASVDRNTAKQWAIWQSNVANAKYFNYPCTVAGFTYDGVNLWSTNSKVHVIDEFAGIDAVLLIASVQFKLDSEGAHTKLVLVLPDSFTVQAERDKAKQKVQNVGRVFDTSQ
jgi:prophage tail gpP-like protein